jgi:hypothetical protein
MTKKHRKVYTAAERAAYIAHTSATRSKAKSASQRAATKKRSPLRHSATEASIANRLAREEEALARFHAEVNARAARNAKARAAMASMPKSRRSTTAKAENTVASAASAEVLSPIPESPQNNMLKAPIVEEGVDLTGRLWGDWLMEVEAKRDVRLNKEQKAALERYRLLPFKKKQIILRQLEKKRAASEALEAAAAAAKKAAEENALLNAEIKRVNPKAASRSAWPALPTVKQSITSVKTTAPKSKGPVATPAHVLAVIAKNYDSLWLGGLQKSIQEKGIERKLKEVFPDYVFKEKGAYDPRYLKEGGIKIRRDAKGEVIGFGYINFTSMEHAKKAYEAFKDNKLVFFEKVNKDDGTFEKVYYKVLVEPAIGQYAEK